MITEKDRSVKLYEGQYKPVALYSNGKKIGGWELEEVTGSTESIHKNTYNAVAKELSISGRAVNVPTVNLSGTALTQSGVYPVETPVQCRLKNKNLCPAPNTVDSTVKVSPNADGTFDVAFSDSTGGTQITDTFTLNAGEYFFSTNISGGTLYVVNGDNLIQPNTAFTLAEKTDVYILIMGGVGNDQSGVWMQIEQGSTASTYTHYISDFSEIEVSRCGKNLVNADLFPNFAKQEDGSYLSTNKIITTEKITLNLPPAIYTVSYSLKSPIDSNYRVAVYYTDGTWQDKFLYSTGEYLSTFFTTNGNAIESIGFYYGTPSNEVQFKDLQLELGDIATDYEPYTEPQTITANADGTVVGLTSLSPNMTLLSNNSGAVINATVPLEITEENLAASADPSPDNYRPIVGAKGKVESEGRNLFDISNLKLLYSNHDGLEIFTPTETGIKVSSTYPGVTSVMFLVFDLGAVDDFIGKTVTISAVKVGDWDWHSSALITLNADGSNREDLPAFGNNAYATATITEEHAGKRLGFRFYVNEWTHATEYEMSNIQFELGDTATPYSPYFSPHSITTPELFGIDDICDTIEGNTITRWIGKIELDGSENWVKLNGDYENSFYIYQPAGGSYETTCVCNTFVGLTREETWKGISGVSLASDEYVRVTQGYDDIFGGDVDVFKAFLAEQKAAGIPVVIYYILKEPYTETIDTPLKTVPRFTRLTSTADVGCLSPKFSGSVKVVSK